jgi:hypothetical protein
MIRVKFQKARSIHALTPGNTLITLPKGADARLVMRARALSVAAVFLGLIAHGAVASGPEPYAPVAVSVIKTPGAPGLVSWAPGQETADFFNVYGVTGDGSLTLVAAHVTDLRTSVPAQFQTYGVVGVKGGLESIVVYPILDRCPSVSWSPPDVGIYDCPDKSQARDHGQMALFLP